MFSLITRLFSSVSHHLGWEVFHQVLIRGSHSRFLFKIPFEVPLQQVPRSAELASKEGGNCNNVTFGVAVTWQLPITALTHWVWLPSRRSVPPHLCHKVGSTSIYKSEGYSVRRVSGMIQDDEGEQESDDEALGGWWQTQSRVYSWSEY